MKRLLLFALAIPCCSAENWKPLFNGKDLKGWHQCNGKASYKVESKQIIGTTAEGSPNSFLCTDRDYGDFLLEFDVMTEPRLNSGVQIRSHQYKQDVEVATLNQTVRRVKHPAGRVYGYQVEIANEKSDDSGGIYDEARRGWLDNVHCGGLKDNAWNRYRVEARGDSIKTWINGKACADLVDPADQTGFIALQVHAFKGDSPAQVRWRNIRIQDLGVSRWKPVDTNGWKLDGGGKMERADGALRLTQIAAEKAKTGFVLSDRDYSDFTLRLKYKITQGNSGVFYRMGDRAARENGFEIEVDPARDLGGFQEPGKRGWMLHGKPEDFAAHYKAGDWNEMVIYAHGGRHTVVVNGFRTAEFKDDPGRKTGRIALQLNPRQDLEVFYKDIEILEQAK